MTPDFESRNNSEPNFLGNLPAGDMGAIDTQKRDRFELLSAFLDGEVSAQERRQVEEWLAGDPQVQCLYARLLKLRKGVRTMPVPASAQPVEATVNQVFSHLDRRRQKQMLMWGGTAVAAVFIGAVSGLFGGSDPFSPQLAQSPTPAVTSEPLMLALNEAVVEIPKAPIASPQNSLKYTGSYYQPSK
ncbi:anti-sigma factor family protein [Argonema antarcticum]|uniref:anti-sigma factor family protein n=1 Tax=Argonema antarcticum TaxID=2942763 RepID=UPI0020114B87|nr:Fis family transcriptional regulator [Argonema antarcticum]MCL1471696.1 Fis family transcriptional regulator [Argonema antarcticum A004/B2]